MDHRRFQRVNLVVLGALFLLSGGSVVAILLDSSIAALGTRLIPSTALAVAGWIVFAANRERRRGKQTQ